MTRRTHPSWSWVVALLGMIMVSTLANATTFQKEATIVDLLQQSDLIIRGTVTSVTDGIDNRGIPYTEVKLHVSDTMRGQVGKEYTFRQFGLIKPHDMGNGNRQPHGDARRMGDLQQRRGDYPLLAQASCLDRLTDHRGIRWRQVQSRDGGRHEPGQQRRSVQERRRQTITAGH